MKSREADKADRPTRPASVAKSWEGRMRTRNDVVVVAAFHGTWSIVVNGEKFGPYYSQEEAVLVARTWAEHAAEQGHRVGLMIDGGRPSQETRH
jgi:hypothetical protein